MTDTTGPAAGPAAPAPDSDPRPLLRLAADQAVRLVGAVTPAELDGPTPCPEFDGRTLCAHVVGVLARINAVAAGQDARALPSIAEVADGDLARAAADGRDAVVAGWADDAVLDRVVTLPFGTLPGRAAALAYTQELTVHAWDLAAATGRTGDLDDTLARAVLPMSRRFVPAETRGGPVPFGPVVPVPDTAGPYDQLAGWLGRDPAWKPSA